MAVRPVVMDGSKMAELEVVYNRSNQDKQMREKLMNNLKVEARRTRLRWFEREERT